MLQHFKNFIEVNALFKPTDRILLAVSGGMDSAVMASLFHMAGYTFGIAHCNFGLRGRESDAEEEFTASLAKKYGVPFFCKKFDTAGYASANKISVQMAARELRYSWFDDIKSVEKFDYIATAHHLDDQVETFLINMVRGTGIAGMHGIFPKQGAVIRPMLFAYRKDIAEYASAGNIGFMEDSSNSEDKYIRNKIRHHIIPLFEEINPDFRNTMTKEILRLREWESLGRKDMKKHSALVIKKERRRTVVDLKALRMLPNSGIYAWEIFSGFGFTPAAAADMLRESPEKSGRTFISATHRAVEDRGSLIIERTGHRINDGGRMISEKRKNISRPLSLHFSVLDHSEGISIPGGREFASLDLDKLVFPLEIRKWKAGDSFHPFGMRGKKKLSDFLIDEKVSIPDKENTWLLCSGEKIAWVIGRRIDHFFRVTKSTKKIYRIESSAESDI